MTSLGKAANDAVKMNFDDDDRTDDGESAHDNEDDDDVQDLNAPEEMVDNDDGANVAPQDLVSMIASISTWRRNFAPSD